MALKNNLIAFALLALLPGHLFAAAAQERSPADAQERIVLSVEDHYRDIADLTAKVTQKNLLKSVGKSQQFAGTLSIKKPGRLRLDYTNGQLILVDGKTALFYSKKSAQVVKKTFTDVEQMNIPVAFLLGAAHIRDDFEPVQPGPPAPGALELVPRRPKAAMKKLRLQADDNGRITALTIYDKSGNTTEITFTDIREGVGLEDRLFVFSPPRGTEIIEQ
ncbi:MAG TPA: outer membrane lipoprotein carrier protein LolA [Nitrospirota bacterium]